MTNHVTNDLANSSISTPCHSNYRVHVGNRAGLFVDHIGSLYLISQNNRSFTLQNLLHVPLITKNLISVSQFARDNKVYFEFHPSVCFVKDQHTGQTLLQRTNA